MTPVPFDLEKRMNELWVENSRVPQFASRRLILFYENFLQIVRSLAAEVRADEASKHRWIPLSDWKLPMPNRNEDVLVFVNEGDKQYCVVQKIGYDEGEWCGDDDATHWMPLPAPPLD